MNLLCVLCWQLCLAWVLPLIVQALLQEETTSITKVAMSGPSPPGLQQSTSIPVNSGVAATHGYEAKIAEQDKQGLICASSQSTPHIPHDATKSFDGSPTYTSFAERWSQRIRILKSALQKTKLAYRRYMRNLKDSLKLLDKHNSLPLFSEKDHLQSIFGEVYGYYESLDEAKKVQFWDIFKQVNQATSRRGLANQRHEPTSQLTLKIHQNIASQALKTLRQLDQDNYQYEQALSTSTQLVQEFLLQHSNGARISKVAQRIRAWKIKHPLKDLKLNYPYQNLFIDLFGPGDLIKPDNADHDCLKKLQDAWGIGKELMATFMQASSDAKKMLGDLYAAEERHSQRGFSRLWTKCEYHEKDIKEATKRQEDIHQKLLQVFGNENNLKEKMNEIAELRATEDFVRKNSQTPQYDLLPFIEPLRAARRYQDHSDIKPLLQSFELHTTPRTIKNLMKLSESLIPLLKIQSRHQMIARDFRTKFEHYLEATTQHRISKILHQTMMDHQRIIPSTDLQTTKPGFEILKYITAGKKLLAKLRGLMRMIIKSKPQSKSLR